MGIRIYIIGNFILQCSCSFPRTHSRFPTADTGLWRLRVRFAPGITATGLALASARSAFMVTMVIVVVIAMAINATDTLIIVDAGTLGIDSAGLGMVVGIITGGSRRCVWRDNESACRTVIFC